MSPIYEYITEFGEPVEVTQEFSECIPIGQRVIIDGVSLLRVASQPQLSVTEDFDQVVGYTMSNEHPSIGAVGVKRNGDGHPVFTSRAQIKKFNADSRRQNDKDPSVVAYGWDGGGE